MHLYNISKTLSKISDSLICFKGLVTRYFFTIFEIQYPLSCQLNLIRFTAQISISDLALREVCDILLYVCSAVRPSVSQPEPKSSCFTSLKLQENRCSRYRGLQLWRAKNLLSTNNLPQSLFALSLSLTFSRIFVFSQPTP